MSEDRDFWTRRRAGVEAERAAEAQAAEAAVAAAEMNALEDKDDSEILAELDLPDPDSLAPGDDVIAFMQRAVPERLRRRALRRLWRLNPVLANVDGLVDYDDDFTDAALAVEVLQTTYQVGKGMLAHLEKLAADAEAEATAEADPEPPMDTAVESATIDDTPEPVETGFTAPSPTKVAIAQSAISEDDDSEEDRAPAPRRMRFAFEG